MFGFSADVLAASLVLVELPSVGVGSIGTVTILKNSRPIVTPPLKMLSVCCVFARLVAWNRRASELGIVVGTLVNADGSPPSRIYVEFPFVSPCFPIWRPHTSSDVPDNERVSWPLSVT